MWNSQVEPSGNQSSSSHPASQEHKKLDYQDNSQIDSGFLSSDHILQSFTEDDHRPAAPHQPKVDLDLDLKKSAPVASSAYFDSGLVEDFASGHGDMLLEKDVGAVLAECLSHSLNLKKSSIIGDSQINNLSTSRKVDTTSPVDHQRNISDAPTGAAAAAAAAAKPTDFGLEMPEEEQPWERCYKQDADGETYLHLAVYDGAEDIVRSLIQITPHPCLLDIQNDLLQSSLHLAVITGNVRIVRLLLLAGAESSTRDRYGNTPLHLACAAGDLDSVKALTERITATEEASVVSCTGVLVANSKQGQGAQPLLINRQQLIQYADVELRNYDGERCVHIAASVTPTEKNKHVEVMRQLVLRSGADVNAREGKAGYTALHMAVERGDTELVQFLLTECPSLNLEVTSYGRWTAYQIAMVNRNEELMAMLQKKGAEALDVSSSDESEDDSDLDGDEVSS